MPNYNKDQLKKLKQLENKGNRKLAKAKKEMSKAKGKVTRSKKKIDNSFSGLFGLLRKNI